MPIVQSQGCPIHVEIEGEADAPALMLSNSLGTTLHMWDDQTPALTRHFRVIRFDRRGHGKSGAPDGPYTFDMLGRDVLAVLDALRIEKAHWCGLSMGGMEGMWLGAKAANRFDKIILSNTAAHYAEKQLWSDRIAAVTKGGTKAIADGAINNWFTKEFQAANPPAVARLRDMLIATPSAGYLGCCAAIRDMDHRDYLPQIKSQTLVIAGRHDPATNIAAAEYIRSRIPNASLTILEAAHISNVEQAHAFTSAVLGFLTGKVG